MSKQLTSPLYCQVALEVPTVSLDRLYTYSVPNELREQIKPGARILAPFRNQKLEGLVFSLIDESNINPSRIKPLIEVRADQSLSQEFIQLAEWMRGRYLTSYVSILKVFTPPKVKPKRAAWIHTLFSNDQIQCVIERLPARAFKQKQVLTWILDQQSPVPLQELLESTQSTRNTIQSLSAQGIISIEYQEEYRSPLLSAALDHGIAITPPPLTDEQNRAVEMLNTKLKKGESGQFLLQGITGSGKTEVYLQAIQTCLLQGKSAIVLVPEISLTPQLVSRFVARFPGTVAVLHSRMSDGERADEWRRIHAGGAKVIIGARSAVFAPCSSIGLIVMDEEHESSYKQEDHPKYHAREIALFRSKYHQALLILGSATPSLETRLLAARGRVKRLELTSRPLGNPLPDVEIVNMCEAAAEGSLLFSDRLKQELSKRLEQREQSILFLNRRGYASFLICTSCGYVPTCSNCDVSLTYHQAYRPRALCCHYCGYAEEATLRCSNCGSQHVKQFGMGTERVESELSHLWPKARVIRMDVDTTRTKGSHERLLHQFRSGEADILLGTQMIAKGHDFPNVSFVGILSADTALHLPDLRASERTFQLLTQVAGRAGRHLKPGKVILQTYHPDHYAVHLAAKQDYEAFYAQEIAVRSAMKNPPFWEISVITVSHDHMKQALVVANETGKQLQKLLNSFSTVIVHDPTPAPIERLNGKHRVHITLRYQRYREIQSILMEWYNYAHTLAFETGAYLSVDVNAQWLV